MKKNKKMIKINIMNLNNITYQPKQSSKKTYKIKEHLSQLASTIKIRMDENQILMDVINIICIDDI